MLDLRLWMVSFDLRTVRVSEDTSPARAKVSVGDKISGYRLEEQIGQGGMAVVYRAHDERLDRQVALKVLAPGLAADTAFRTRFIRESRAAAAVDHPNIIPVYDAGDAGGFLYISMRYVQGGDVRSLLRDGQTLPPARAWHIISQVASALDAAHVHGLVHRDVKPANMLLDASSRTGTGKGGPGAADPHDHVYLSDFGISKQRLASNLTSTGQFVGTLDYIAPEQVEGQAADGRADQYSLACTAFELLSGSPPYRRPTGLALISAHLTEPPPSLRERRAGLPANVDAVLAKAMAKSADERYGSCEQFATDLGRALGQVPGVVEAARANQPSADQPGADQPKPWPATELAKAVPGPGPSSGPPGPAVAVTAQPAPLQVTPPVTAPGSAAANDPSTMLAPPQQQPPQRQPQPQPQPTRPEDPARYGSQYGQQQVQPPPGQFPGWQQPQQPPPGQNFPGWQQPQQPPPAKRSRIGLVIASVVVLGVAGGATAAVLLLHKPAPPPNPPRTSPATSPATSPPSTAAAQATAISDLIMTSGASRGKLQPAVSDIENNCYGLSPSQFAADVATIRSVADNRGAEYTQAFNLRVDALANGTTLKSGLLDALQASQNADNDYLQWAREEQAGCFPATNSAAFNDAGTWDTKAVTAKTSFANEWNPVAQQYSLPTVTEADI